MSPEDKKLIEEFFPGVKSERMFDMESTLRLMEQNGGSFVKKLASLYRSADADNSRKLLVVFGEYFEKYDPEKW